MDSSVFKLVMWWLGALFIAMTGIGGFTASHLVAQVDTLSITVNVLQQKIDTMSATSDIYRMSMENRLTRIEHRLEK